MSRIVNVTRIHGAKSTARLLGVGGLCAYLGYYVLSNSPDDEMFVWGWVLIVFSALCLYSGFRGRS